jgi:AcrR family transcriptional regulator
LNREEKNAATREKIMKSAVSEFAAHGYQGASMNRVSSGGGISKGIIYHYFDSKKELYLSCVERCFSEMTSYINDALADRQGNVIDTYFDARVEFLGSNPEMADIFCEAAFNPPEGFSKEINELRKPLDELNVRIFDKIADEHEIRKDIDRSDAVSVFRVMQNYINGSFRENGERPSEERIREHERECRTAVSVFLYGIIAR